MFKELKELIIDIINQIFPDHIVETTYSDFFTFYTYREAVKFAKSHKMELPKGFRDVQGVYYLNLRTDEYTTDVPEDIASYYADKRRKQGIFTAEEELHMYCGKKYS